MVGLDSIPPENWPPVLIPFFSFRIMVGCGLAMLALAWIGSYLNIKGRIERGRLLLWLTFLSFPPPFIGILTVHGGGGPPALGDRWGSADGGRDDAFPDGAGATISLLVFCAVYVFIFSFGTFYIYRLLRAGPVGNLVLLPTAAVPNRPVSVVDEQPTLGLDHHVAGE